MFSAIARDHITRPRNMGALEMATHHGVAGTPGEGPYMIVSLRIFDGLIVEAAFQTYGCPSAIACGSLLTEIVKRRPVETARKLEPADLIRILRGLPEGREECAERAVVALRNALNVETESSGG